MGDRKEYASEECQPGKTGCYPPPPVSHWCKWGCSQGSWVLRHFQPTLPQARVLKWPGKALRETAAGAHGCCLGGICGNCRDWRQGDHQVCCRQHGLLLPEAASRTLSCSRHSGTAHERKPCLCSLKAGPHFLFFLPQNEESSQADQLDISEWFNSPPYLPKETMPEKRNSHLILHSLAHKCYLIHTSVTDQPCPVRFSNENVSSPVSWENVPVSRGITQKHCQDSRQFPELPFLCNLWHCSLPGGTAYTQELGWRIY